MGPCTHTYTLTHSVDEGLQAKFSSQSICGTISCLSHVSCSVHFRCEFVVMRTLSFCLFRGGLAFFLLKIWRAVRNVDDRIALVVPHRTPSPPLLTSVSLPSTDPAKGNPPPSPPPPLFAFNILLFALLFGIRRRGIGSPGSLPTPSSAKSVNNNQGKTATRKN